MPEPNAPPTGWRGSDDTAAYLGRAMAYRPGVWESTESIWSTGLGWLTKRIVSVGAVLLVVFIAIAALTQNSSVILFALGPTFAACILLALSSRLVEPISDWRIVLADRAPAAESVYSAVFGRLRERRVPVSVAARRVAIDSTTINRIILVNQDYTATISVFGYGTALYLGWTMTRSRRGWQLLGQFVARARGVDTWGVESARAMHETVHAVCLEGLQVATNQIVVPQAYGFPAGLPPIERPDGADPSVPHESSLEDNWAVAIYLRDGGNREGEEIRAVVEQFWAELGFELVAEFDPILGSFFQKLRAKATSPNSRAALRELMGKLERAAEVQVLAVPESQANLNNAQGLAVLIQALAKESAAVIRLGQLVLVKVSQPDGTSQIYSRTLTPSQLKHLERHPELLKDPGNILLVLDAARDEP